MDGKSLDIVQENIDKLKQLFPSVFSEGKINLDRLKQELGEDLYTANEHYELSWTGKNEARQEIQKRTTATLIPDKEGSINFDEAKNIFIEGENLEVLRVLQQSYFGKIKMIYIDPPYNTGNDSFVYPDDYSERRDEYLKRTGAIDEEGFLNKQDLWGKNTKESGRYHSAWLSMMYPRLNIARNLLREDGVIFISIDDNEQANLKLLCDEVFGEENLIEVLKWKRKKQPSFLSKHTAKMMEYILVYASNKPMLEKLSIEGTSDSTKKVLNVSNNYSLRNFRDGVKIKLEGKGFIPKGKYSIKTMEVEYLNDIYYENGLTLNSVDVRAKFSVSQEKIDSYIDNGLLFITINKGLRRDVSKDEIGKRKSITDLLVSGWGDNQESEDEIKKLFGNVDYFEYTKPTQLLKNLIKTNNTENNIILDFFAGSGTTAQAVLDQNEEDGGNRRFICVQMPAPLDEQSEAYQTGEYRTIADICKERIRRSIAQLENKREGTIDFDKKQKLAFAAYKLQPSNFKIWQSDADKIDLKQQLLDFTQSEKAESLPQNMLIELLLKTEKEALTIPYIYDNEFYKTQNKWFCFKPYSIAQKEHLLANKPESVIYLSSSFGTDDEALTNLKLELEENNIKLTLI